MISKQLADKVKIGLYESISFVYHKVQYSCGCLSCKIWGNSCMIHTFQVRQHPMLFQKRKEVLIIDP